MRQIRSHAPASRRTLARSVVGTEAEVGRIVAAIRDSDRLVHMTAPQETPDGRVWVNVRFLDRPQPAPAPRRQRRRWPAVAAAGTGVTVLGVAAYALVQLVDAVIALLPVIAGGLLLLALVAVIAGGGSSRVACVTLHGPGCRRH